jgi:hypothetical protein
MGFDRSTSNTVSTRSLCTEPVACAEATEDETEGNVPGMAVFADTMVGTGEPRRCPVPAKVRAVAAAGVGT